MIPRDARLIGIMPLSSIAMSAALAPRIEIYTLLACSVHKPDIFQKIFPEFGGGESLRFRLMTTELDTTSRSTGIGINSNHLLGVNGTTQLRLPNVDLSGLRLDDEPVDEKPPTCASDPIVQAEVAKLTVCMLNHYNRLRHLSHSPLFSNIYIHGYPKLFDNWVVGCRESFAHSLVVFLDTMASLVLRSLRANSCSRNFGFRATVYRF
jgi:hypothetical protein